MSRRLPIGVMGAGAIGCFVGGRLAARGADVVLVGRERTKAELVAHGLVLQDLEGPDVRVAVGRARLPSLPGPSTEAPGSEGDILFATDASALADRDVVLCCVKSGQTAEAADRLAAVLGANAVVVSFQNGVRNADVLRERLPRHTVLGGIVTFNVVAAGEGVFRRATSGPLVIERREGDARVEALAQSLRTAGFDVVVPRDVRPLQWTKLVMNLNNAVGALSGAPTRDLLFVPGYRRVLAAVIREALAVLRAARVPTARLGPMPVAVFPYVLSLPTPLLRVVASAQVKVDPEARSSMWQDLTRGRATEVDHLNGEIVRLAREHGIAAPLNERTVELVHEVERAGRGSPNLSPEALWSALTSTARPT